MVRIRARGSEHLGKVIVNLASVPYKKNYNLIFVLVYLIDHSIVAYSHAPEIRLPKWFSIFSWVFTELLCTFDYSGLSPFFYFPLLFRCFGVQQNSEGHSISSRLTRDSGCFFASSLRFMSMLKKLIVFSRS